MPAPTATDTTLGRQQQRPHRRLLHWLLRRWHAFGAGRPRKRKRVLLYVGLHKGREFDLIFRDYDVCYGFEANPELYAVLQQKYALHPQVRLFNAAATTADGPVTLHISSNDGASSSLGTFDDAWEGAATGRIRMVGEVTVPGMNLYGFCRREGIDAIDDYVSDIQGMDLEVLKTLRPLIEARRIETITVETALDAKRNIYQGIPSNAESDFLALLGAHYRLIAMGYGVLRDHWFSPPDPGSWEIDCKWKRRGPPLPASRVNR